MRPGFWATRLRGALGSPRTRMGGLVASTGVDDTAGTVDAEDAEDASAEGALGSAGD